MFYIICLDLIRKWLDDSWKAGCFVRPMIGWTMNAAPSTLLPSNSRPSKYGTSLASHTLQSPRERRVWLARLAWDDTLYMGRALSAVTMESMTIRQASLYYGVLISTLFNRVSSRVLIGRSRNLPWWRGRKGASAVSPQVFRNWLCKV